MNGKLLLTLGLVFFASLNPANASMDIYSQELVDQTQAFQGSENSLDSSCTDVCWSHEKFCSANCYASNSPQSWKCSQGCVDFAKACAQNCGK